jgi:Thrombospondin type 3 repeat
MTGRIVAAIGLATVTALAAVWAAAGPTQATTFNPFFGPPEFYSLDDSATPGYPDHDVRFNILPPSANFSDHFGGLIGFGDSDVIVADSAGIPGKGAYVGSLQTVAHLGLANDGCNSEVPVTFDLVEAETSTAARPMTPNVTLTGAISATATSFTYTSAGDPIGPSDSNPAFTRAEIEIDSEQLLVESINEGTNTYSFVTRGWNGTTPAPHAAGAQVRKVNVIFPAGPTSNLLANLGEDDGDLDNNGTAEFPDYAANGIADANEAVPSFVRDSLDPNVNADDGGYMQPRARYAGVAFVANALVTVLQFVVFDPGALTIFPNLDWATSAWGYPSVTFLNDPQAPPSNSAINDFCNFTSDTKLFGVPHDNACTSAAPAPGCNGVGAGFTLRFAVDGGCPGVTTPNECGTSCGPNCPPPCNPGACYRSRFNLGHQPARFYQYAVSQRDYDNDGHENGLDPCPYNPNASWDPRVPNNLSGGDTDADGLPNECDRAPGAFNNDQDGDGWQNRIDNCPTMHNSMVGGGGGTVPNTFQFDQDVDPGVDVPDGGPPSDDIGAACDVAANSCAGCPALTPTGANGHYHATAAAQTVCIGPPSALCSSTSDSDGDGVVNAIDTCVNGANSPFTFAGPFGQDTLAAPATSGDSTIIVGGGGFTQGSPIVIGSPLETLRYITSQAGSAVSFTPPLEHDHQVGDPVAQVAFAQSLRDLNNDGFADISDVSFISGAFGSQGGDPSNDGVGDSGVPGYQGRYDSNYDSFVDISDVSAMTGVFGAACGPPP